MSAESQPQTDVRQRRMLPKGVYYLRIQCAKFVERPNTHPRCRTTNFGSPSLDPGRSSSVSGYTHAYRLRVAGIVNCAICSARQGIRRAANLDIKTRSSLSV